MAAWVATGLWVPEKRASSSGQKVSQNLSGGDQLFLRSSKFPPHRKASPSSPFQGEPVTNIKRIKQDSCTTLRPGTAGGLGMQRHAAPRRHGATAPRRGGRTNSKLAPLDGEAGRRHAAVARTAGRRPPRAPAGDVRRRHGLPGGCGGRRCGRHRRGARGLGR